MSAAVKPLAPIADQLERDRVAELASTVGELPSSRAAREATAEHGDDFAQLTSVELRALAATDPEEAIVEATRYMHQKQDRLRVARVKVVQLIAAHATASGSPPIAAIPGGSEAKRAMDAADSYYRLAVRDWVHLILLTRLGPRE